MVQYEKNRRVGGFNVYARDYGEGIMLFTYDEERNMIPVWINRFVCNQLKGAIEYGEAQAWDDELSNWRRFMWRYME